MVHGLGPSLETSTHPTVPHATDIDAHERFRRPFPCRPRYLCPWHLRCPVPAEP
ncbi:hypothetical protein SBD_7878 [Streptomyces bottropensis ATCC 25435]|uniref:Uncharacterized protein n=1 Tax=Streptomyces bottropensis ATCC 25435 TaxID=1054862 RepID=M3FGL6_9ACTN|nr:hypothetical protein SBD_7878 [Streptomyces bottropensis ATCC 25435]